MKVRKIVKKMYQAIIDGDAVNEKILWLKTIKKSLKGKNTSAVK